MGWFITRKLDPPHDNVVAVSTEPTHIMLRKSGKKYYGSEDTLVSIDNGVVTVDTRIAIQYGLQVHVICP